MPRTGHQSVYDWLAANKVWRFYEMRDVVPKT